MIQVHPSWQEIVSECYSSLDKKYRDFLENDNNYFPDKNNFLNAFKTLALEDTKYILFGQDPYPRKDSAIGYAFIDGLVNELFSESGLSKSVNKATSLRNFIKMLLVSDGKLDINNTSQEEILKVSKENIISCIIDLKNNFESNGVLLLNTALIFTSKKDTSYHARQFLPFMDKLLHSLKDNDIEIILFGNIADMIEKKLEISKQFKTHKTPHPYNVGFIKDKSAIDFFKPMQLLSKR
ncbi:MAG: uracil-DNA glycosylase [Sulfurospirillaceae bacterium]|nr:uracil-DNA glycosylase [Sulfurospirillaceae bacterium]